MDNLQIYEEFKVLNTLEEKVEYLGDIIRNNFMYPDIIIGDEAFDEAVKLGIDVIPIMIKHLREGKNYSWVSALYDITKEDPYKGAKSSPEFVKSWIDWYDTSYEEWLKKYNKK